MHLLRKVFICCGRLNKREDFQMSASSAKKTKSSKNKLLYSNRYSIRIRTLPYVSLFSDPPRQEPGLGLKINSALIRPKLVLLLVE